MALILLAVEFERNIKRLGAGIALLLSAAAQSAAPAEPLTVTKLGDPELKLLISGASDNVPASDSDEFGRAVSAAVRAQQQSMQASCQSTPAASSSIAARWSWEARCRYRRY